MQSPWPVSAFSDYSSSECSTQACTPYSTVQDDPYQLDTGASSTRPDESADSYFPLQPPPDDYESFAVGIQRNPMNYTFVLPSFPAKGLAERRRQSVPENKRNTASSPAPPTTTASQSCTSNEEAVPKEMKTQSLATDTLASRRRRPSLKPLGIRAHSYTETHTSFDKEHTLPVRRTNSMGDEPAYLGGTLEPPIPSLQSEAPESVTRLSNTRLSQLFSPQALLPPPSPPSSGEDDRLYGHIHHQISPPHTPQPPSAPLTLEAERAQEESQDALKAFRRPRTVPPQMTIPLPPNDHFVAALSGMTIGSSEHMSQMVDMYSKREMFPFDDIIGQMI